MDYQFKNNVHQNEINQVLKQRKLKNIGDDMDPDTIYVVFNDIIVGYYSVCEFDEYIILLEFEILENFREQGHARVAIEHVIEIYKGKSTILNPDNSNARSFFEYMGFTERKNQDDEVIELIKKC